MGVFIEPPEHVVGLRRPADHYAFRTKPEGARSGPGDTDLVTYSLRKYLRLAAKGRSRKEGHLVNRIRGKGCPC